MWRLSKASKVSYNAILYKTRQDKRRVHVCVGEGTVGDPDDDASEGTELK